MAYIRILCVIQHCTVRIHQRTTWGCIPRPGVRSPAVSHTACSRVAMPSPMEEKMKAMSVSPRGSGSPRGSQGTMVWTLTHLEMNGISPLRPWGVPISLSELWDNRGWWLCAGQSRSAEVAGTEILGRLPAQSLVPIFSVIKPSRLLETHQKSCDDVPWFSPAIKPALSSGIWWFSKLKNTTNRYVGLVV